MIIALKRACGYVAALSALVLVAAVPPAAASTPTAGVPEIDGASISAGLGLLAAGVLMLRARRSK